MIFKKRKQNIIYFTIAIMFGLMWFFVYNNVNEYTLYQNNNTGKIDSTKVYMVAPKYTKKVLSKTDTLYVFFDKNNNVVITIKKDSLKYFTIKK